MNLAHLFFPENDLALAANLSNYTPPRMARALRLSGEVLPMWYGDDGDCFLTQGVNERWLESMHRAFELHCKPYDHCPERFAPRPWGWSAASRRQFQYAGYTAEMLPDDMALERLRQISHRRSSCVIAQALAAQLPDTEFTSSAIEARTLADALDVIDRFRGDAVVKSPWSNAGRGIAFTRGFGEQGLVRRLEDIIAAYGSVLVELRHDKEIDFAMLFDAHADASVSYRGLSLFEADARGAYTHNIVADDSILTRHIAAFIPEKTLSTVAEALSTILQEYIAGSYVGPLGVDMLVARRNCFDVTKTEQNSDADTQYVLNPCVELNLRNTMGHLAHCLGERILAPGRLATFATMPNPTPSVNDFADPVQGLHIADHRLHGGKLVLNPPSSPFVFELSL